MSLSSSMKLIAVLAVTAMLPLLAACSGFRPVYGDAAGAVSRYSFEYGTPATRLDQVLYTELRLRLGPDTGDAGTVKVVVSTSANSRAITRTAVVKPATTNEMTVSGSFTVTGADGEEIASGSRTASALYETTGQVLADTAAQSDASERAARALAETIRLAILGALEARPGA